MACSIASASGLAEFLIGEAASMDCLLSRPVHENKMHELALELESRGYSKSADTVERFQFGLWNYNSFPRSHWKRIRTTNGLERINKELKRRSRVAGAFPSDESFMRLGVSILIDINEEWMMTKRYLSMDVD
jgi:putative transposase